jgi:hypothetical protein
VLLDLEVLVLRILVAVEVEDLDLEHHIAQQAVLVVPVSS